MKILELSGDTGSTLAIANDLAAAWSELGHATKVIAPVSRFDIGASWHCLRNRPSLIHSHLGDGAVMARRIQSLFAIPVLATLHGFQKAKHYQGIKYLTAVSQAVKEHYVAEGLPQDAIRVIPNGYPPELATRPAQTLRQQMGFSDDTFLIGNMGTYTPVKRQHLLIDAMAKLISGERKYHLLLAGEGPLKNSLLAQVKQLGLEQHVTFLGFIQDRAPFYYALNIYVQPSELEGFCMPLLEAMACHIPIITSFNKGAEDFVVPNKNGIVLNIHSASALAEAIAQLAGNPEQCRQLSQQAAHDAAPYQWPVIARQYDTYMQEILAC